jgi:hypothetical protein
MINFNVRINLNQVPVTHPYSLTYLVGWDGEDEVWGQPLQIVCETPISKTNTAKMNWLCGSTAPALQL